MEVVLGAGGHVVSPYQEAVVAGRQLERHRVIEVGNITFGEDVAGYSATSPAIVDATFIDNGINIDDITYVV